MKNVWKKKSSCKKGLGYIYVIFASVILIVFLTCTLTLVLGNLRQAKYQESKLQAYYLALSGIDLATAALLQQGSGETNDTLLYQVFVLGTREYIEDTELQLADGKVYLKVNAFSKDGEKWIKVLSKGTLTSSNVSQTVTMSFPINNPSQKVWD